MKQIVDATAVYVRQRLAGEGSGHDWWHIYRVWQLAKTIAEKEGVATEVVELTALLHDIADWKFTDGDETVGPKIAGEWLAQQGVDGQTIQIVQEAMSDVTYLGAGVQKKVRSKVGEIVQDADRLDAIGAIGIARCFAYGGYKGREIYNQEIKPTLHQTAEEYKKNGTHSINHFYEKLLLLKDRMNTQTAKEMAQERHQFMESFLEQFYAEWDGTK